MSAAIKPTVAELRARVTEKGPWFVVPAEARATTCKSCGVMVYFARQPSEKLMPIDVLVPGGFMPRRAEHVAGRGMKQRDGRGVSHLATCPEGPAFRKRA